MSLPRWIVFLSFVSSTSKRMRREKAANVPHIHLCLNSGEALWSRCLKDTLPDITSSFCQRGLHILGDRALTLSLHPRGC